MTNIYLEYSIMKNTRYDIRLSDFDYTDTNNETHNMSIMNKGDFGKLHVFKLDNGELFASDNVWYTGSKEPENNFELVKRLDKNEFLEKYSDKNVKLFNSLDCVKDADKPDVIEACEFAITRTKKIKFISDNTKVLLYIDLYDGNQGVKVVSQPIKVFEDGINYELTVYEDYGDFCETYDTIEEAYTNAFKYLKQLMAGLYAQLDSSYCSKHKSLLPTIKKKYIDDRAKELVKLNNLEFYVDDSHKMFKELNDNNLKILDKDTYKLTITKYKSKPKIHKFIQDA